MTLLLRTIKHDWAILILRDALTSNRSRTAIRMPRSGARQQRGDRARGYGMDHQYVLSVHKGCLARVDAPDAGDHPHVRLDAWAVRRAILLLQDGNQC